MDPLLVFPDPPPPELAQTLDLSGLPWKAVANAVLAEKMEREISWSGAVVVADQQADQALSLCRALRKRRQPLAPLLLLVNGGSLLQVDPRDDLFDDFCLTPFQPRELEMRLTHLLWRAGRASRPELIEHGPLVLNIETYQAAIEGRPLDLTYMEYELLKFLAGHPGKVFTREVLLSRVWG
jgi:DNA-binding response OmpR family regulator